MSTGPALALLGLFAMSAFAMHMVGRPHAWLGQGTAPIADPRVIRVSGIFFLVLGGAMAALILYQFVTE